MFSVFFSHYKCIFNCVNFFLMITETVLKLIPMSTEAEIISVKNWLRHGNRYNIHKDVLLLLLFKILILFYSYILYIICFLIINFHTYGILNKDHIY